MMGQRPRQIPQREVRIFSWGGVCQGNSKSCELNGLIEACPGAKDRVICSAAPLVARVFFNSWDAAVEAVQFMWEQRLLGMHHWTPCLFPKPGSGNIPHEEVERRLRTLFLNYIRALPRGEAARRCREEISAVEKELQNTARLLKARNSLLRWEQLESLKQGLLVQRDQISSRLSEFEKALKCLEFYLSMRVGNGGEDGHGDDRDIDAADERPLFKLEKRWTWHQLHNIILRECKRLELGLPMYGSRWDVIQRVHLNQVIVLIGETGSGKSTQLVQFLADSGFAFKGSLACTQPRKVAATALAQRVAGECKGCYGDTSCVSSCTTYTCREQCLAKIMYMTDHVLLQLCMSDPELAHISCIVVDEAHERSLSTDLLLALLKRCLLKRPELRLIIMSATADADTLSDYFCGCSIFHVEGRNFPVDIKYVANDEAEASHITPVKNGQVNIPCYVTQVIKTVSEIHAQEEDGAILAFLTSQIEVEWARDQFQKSSATTLALHGKLSIEEQNRVFDSPPAGKRKVIFATNVAETSLTIPGVRYVVDCGMAKESRFDSKTGMNVLRVDRISRSAAAQRCGRAGRTQPGICYRLYTQEDFDAMAPHRDPEILRVHLGIAVLKLLALGIHDLESFDFVQAPPTEATNMAVKNLIQLGAVAYGREGLQLTEYGLKLVKLGIEPRLGKIILDSFSQGLGREGLVLAAVMANAGSMFCRVGTEADKARSDRLKLRFCHPDGDLFTLLAVYKEWEHESKGSKNKWCWENSINAKSMARCRDAVAEMELCLKHELNIIAPKFWSWSLATTDKYGVALRRIIFSSMVENLAMFSGYDRLGYDVASTGQQAHLHPSCSLLVFGHKPNWVVFGELLCTTRQFLVCATVVEQDWVSAIQPHPTYDIGQLYHLAIQKKVISGLGRCLLNRFTGKGNHNLHHFVTCVQETFKSQRFGIEVDHEQREIQIFSVADYMDQASGMLMDVLKCEKRWISNECMEKYLFYPSRGKHSPVALFGAGAEIKHLQLEDKFLSVEVCHPDVRSLNDRELLLMFDNCSDGIAGFHKHSGAGQEGEETGKWGMITFFSPEAAQTAVYQLSNVQLGGSYLTVCPLKLPPSNDHKKPGFPAVKATLMWPRRQSKGLAVIRCADEDVDQIVIACSGIFIGRSCAHCRRGRSNGSVLMSGLDTEITEKQIWQALRHATDRSIVDLFLIRLPAIVQPMTAACETALLQELTLFVPPDKCQVVVHNSDPKDFNTRALVIFDGSIHLRAARALSYLQGKTLSVCMPWQKITCHQAFYSTVLCPAPIYSVLKTELHALLESLQRQNSGLKINLDKTEYGSVRLKICSNMMEVVAKCRSSLEQLLNGTLVTDDKLDPAAIQLLFTREGFQLLKSLERQTKTYILFEKRNLSIKIFGPGDKTDQAVKDLVHNLMLLHENKHHEISLRGGGMPHELMKEIVKRFGVELHGLKELIPEAEFILDTRRHVLSIHGSKEAKLKAGHVITGTANCLKGLDDGMLTKLEKRANSCPICFCDIEDCYRLEGCGHEFCRSCLIDQCNSAIRYHEGFPLVCAHENCSGLVLIADLKCLLSNDQLDDLFRASVGAFVASSKGAYRFCTTPDCPSVYEVSDSSRLFVCGSCSTELCTTCHLEYHPFLTCQKYKEFKQDPDASLKEWCRGKEDVKRCPICGFTIEKIEGCNHILCKCGDPTSSCKLSLRPSMRKYMSKNTNLDVLSWTKYRPCYLNRQIITLLSTLGVQDHNFELMQQKAMENLDQILISGDRALEILPIMSAGDNYKALTDMLMCGYLPDSEPYLSMMLQAFRASKLLELRFRTRIFVPDGRCLMGCLDETGRLKYGQVFIQVTDFPGKGQFHNVGCSAFGKNGLHRTCVLEGQVVVAKNPCLHPGDVRILTALNIPELQHMVDCVVFPQQGKRPHPNECSGSDLDGDLYFVCWDKSLIPPRQDPPMNYIPQRASELDHEVSIKEIQEYFANYMINDTLGIIANSHTVFADQEPEKARSSACLQLAELFSTAVDFPKTGIAAQFPRNLYPKEYPDFMEKEDKPMYDSTGVIGKLYRSVKKVAPSVPSISSFTKDVARRAYDKDLEVHGFENYLSDALMHKYWYDSRLNTLMDHYGVSHEAEIVSGNISSLSRYHRKKQGDIREVIMLAMKSLRKEAREWFEAGSDTESRSSDDQFAKASAWYHVTYHPDYLGDEDHEESDENSCHFISFPWVICDILLQIKRQRQSHGIRK